MPITNATVVPIVMAARLFNEYQKRRVFAQRTDRTWQGVLANGGNTIRISKGADQSVADYAVNETITYSNADAVHVVDLGVPKQKRWAVKLDDINALQSSARLLDEAVRLSGIALAEQVDADVKAAWDENTGHTDAAAVTIDHDAASLSADDFRVPVIHRVLDVGNMPPTGRWLMVGPYSAELIRKYALQNVILNAPVVSELQNGRIGNFGGLDIYVYDGSYATTTTPSNDKFTATEDWYFGNDTACAFVDQLDRSERLRLETTFADAVRGLYTYGAKTVKADRLYKSVATINNVPVA